MVGELAEAGIRVSLFIAAEPRADRSGVGDRRAGDRDSHRRLVRSAGGGRRRRAAAEFARIARGAALAARLGLEVHAGHGLDFSTAEEIAALPEIVELNIGHFLIGEAIFDGLDAAVRKMRAAMDRGRSRPKGSAAP